LRAGQFIVSRQTVVALIAGGSAKGPIGILFAFERSTAALVAGDRRARDVPNSAGDVLIIARLT
ncbi:hypothetical protein ABTJ98_21500, partial [Acinetobacter baumannii]